MRAIVRALGIGNCTVQRIVGIASVRGAGRRETISAGQRLNELPTVAAEVKL